MEKQKQTYLAPAVKVVSFQVEGGFATSGEYSPNLTSGFQTESFNDGGNISMGSNTTSNGGFFGSHDLNSNTHF